MYFDSIWGIGALHSAWNFTQDHIYGSEVSGAATTVSIFKMESPQEKALINGGSFGPEGGMVVTIIMLAGVILLFLALRRRDVSIPV